MDTPQSSLGPLSPSPIYHRMLEGINEAELAMRKAAEENAAAYKDALLKVVEGVAAGFLERHRDAQHWTGAQWGQGQVSEVVQVARQSTYEQMKDARARQLEKERDEAQQQLAVQRQDIRELEKQLSILQQIVRQGGGGKDEIGRRKDEGERQVAEATTEDSSFIPHSSSFPTLPEAPYTLHLQIPAPPDWWEYNGTERERVRDFHKKALFLALLGETGYSSRKWMERMVSPLIAVEGTGRSACRRLIESLAALQWIEILELDNRDSRLPHALRLTDAGREIFRKIFQAEPVECEFDKIQRHHGDNTQEHTLVCVGAADQFRRRGATVVCMPDPIRLEGVCSFQPDLSVTVQTAEGVKETWLVECERGEGPDNLPATQRGHKWMNSMLVQGAVYLVAPESKTRAELVGEILKVARHGRIYATDVATMQKSGEFWAEVREI